MTMSSEPAATRRSALAAVHHALATRGAAASAWPISYGDIDAERRAVSEAIGLAEPGLYDKWLVRGPGALAACRSIGLEGQPGLVTPAPPGGINVWAVADDEVWLVAYAPTPGGPSVPAVDFGPITASLRSAGAFVTDVSSGWSVLRLAGPRVRALPEALVAEDLAPSLVPDQAILQVPLGGSRVILCRRDYEAIPGFTLLVARDEAEHLWSVLVHIGEPHGIRPVGAMALLPAPPSAAGGAGAASSAAEAASVGASR
jgi:heterotetrameric sarcosine oxidase gamma subunit